jgi:hypothetical protein
MASSPPPAGAHRPGQGRVEKPRSDRRREGGGRGWGGRDESASPPPRATGGSRRRRPGRGGYRLQVDVGPGPEPDPILRSEMLHNHAAPSLPPPLPLSLSPHLSLLLGPGCVRGGARRTCSHCWTRSPRSAWLFLKSAAVLSSSICAHQRG